MLPQITALTIAVTLIYAAWTDLATRIIPNGTCLVIAAAGIVARAMAGPVALGWSVGLAVLLFVILALAHARGYLGGGDVKLLSALAIGLPPSAAVDLITGTALAGGALAALHLVLRHLPPPIPCAAAAPALRRVLTAERWRIRRHAPLPYGIAIACGGCWVLLSNHGS